MWWSPLIPVVLAACVVAALRVPKVAVLACPPLLVAAAIAGGIFIGAAAAFAMIGIIFLVLGLVMSTRRRPGADEWHHLLAKIQLIVLIALWVINQTFGVFAPPAPYGPVLLVLGLVLWILYAMRTREAMTVDLITTIAAGVRQNLPLVDAMTLAAHGRCDRFAFILRGMAQLLWKGLPLSQALKETYRNCPPNIIAGLQMAERLGQLPAYLQSLQADHTRAARENRRTKPSAATYVAVVLVITIIVLQMVGFVVMPRFLDIFAKMGRNLPTITQFVFFHSGKVFSVIFLMSLVAMGLCLLSLLAWFRPWVRLRLRYALAAVDWFKWHLPGLGWFERNRSLLITAEALRVTLQAGRSLEEGIVNATTMDLNMCWRRRLNAWHGDIVRGQLPAPAARCAHLPSSLAWVFDTDSGCKEPAAVLEAIEGICRSRYAYRLNLLNSILWPIMVFILGCWVGLVTLSMFLPQVCLLMTMGK